MSTQDLVLRAVRKAKSDGDSGKVESLRKFWKLNAQDEFDPKRPTASSTEDEPVDEMSGHSDPEGK